MSNSDAKRRPDVVLMCGPPGAGKTTYAKELEARGYVRLSIDEEVWHADGRFGIDYPSENYEHVSAQAEARLRERLPALIAQGSDVVVDYSFWRKRRRDEYKALVERAGARWRLIYLKVPTAELRRRLQSRSARFDANAAFPIDEALLARYLASFEEPVGEEAEIIPWRQEGGDGGRVDRRSVG